MSTSFPDPFKGHRFPREIISYAVWLYYRFSLSLRDVEDILAHRGITVSCETINNWEEKFGPLFADQIRRHRPKPGDKWHLDEVVIKIKGETFYLWRAVDQYGDVLDIMVQKRRNRKAAKRFLKKLVKRYGQPRVMITDKLRSYGAAKQEVMPDVDHRQHKGLNNRAETSHKPTRTGDAKVQVATSCTAILCRPWPDQHHLSSPPTSSLSQQLPSRKKRCLRPLERVRQGTQGGINKATGCILLC